MIDWLRKKHILCSWSKWTDTETGDILARTDLINGMAISGTPECKPRRVGTYVRQTRICSVCGRRQLRTEESK